MNSSNTRIKTETNTSFCSGFLFPEELLQYVLSPSNANIPPDWCLGVGLVPIMQTTAHHQYPWTQQHPAGLLIGKSDSKYYHNFRQSNLRHWRKKKKKRQAKKLKSNSLDPR